MQSRRRIGPADFVGRRRIGLGSLAAEVGWWMGNQALILGTIGLLRIGLGCNSADFHMAELKQKQMVLQLVHIDRHSQEMVSFFSEHITKTAAKNSTDTDFRIT